MHTPDPTDTPAHAAGGGGGVLVNGGGSGDDNENGKDHCSVSLEHDDAADSDHTDVAGDHAGGDGDDGDCADAGDRGHAAAVDADDDIAADDLDHTDIVSVFVSFIHGWQSWKAHHLCSALRHTVLENHHSGDQSWRGDEKWFLHPDDALAMREVVGADRLDSPLSQFL